METIAGLLYGPFLLSWATTVLGTGALCGPLLVLVRLTRRSRARLRWAARGAGFGFLVLPLSVWLYAHFFTDPLRALVLGFPGLLLILHFAPFQDAGAVSHSIVANTAVGASSSLRSAVIPGVPLWTCVYGLLGYLVGVLTERRRGHLPGA